LQTIRPPRPDLGFLPTIGAEAHITSFRAYLDDHPRARPVLEWAIRWLETHLPEPLPPVLCHRDFRTGNYMVEGAELTGILDWEFAGWGDPDEDIGWFCCKGWRFARLDREAGGIAARTVFYRAYEAASGRRLDPARVRFWEVLANLRWAVIALQQSDRVLRGGARDLSTAIIGRRATECELELLMLLDGNGSRASCPPATGAATVPETIRDLPGSSALLALGRERLLDTLLPLVPPEKERELHLLATAIAIAEREALAGEAPARDIMARLIQFYGGSDHASLHRFAADLRAGAFAACNMRAHAARALLWRLTILKLREGNPQFLAANGFGE
ncbi:MAG: phosphotransferase, partial [Stellaceae bacterium]